MSSSTDLKLPAGRELDRIVTMQEAEEISTLSEDSLKRHHGDKIIKLSPRRLGMRLGDALNLRKT
jgi:hypothetical protein